MKSEIEKWKIRFLEKFGDFNFFHLRDISQVEKGTLQEILTAPSFLGQKKLVFIELSDSKEEKEDTGYEVYLEALLSNIPEESIIVFYTNSYKEKNSLHKKLIELGERKDFSLGEDIYSTISFLQRKYENIGKREIETIVGLKSGNLDKSIREIEKLLTFSQHPNIQDIQENISAEPEESIFQFINILLGGNFGNIHTSFNKLKEQMNFYYFYNTLLGSLRSVVFIESMKCKNIPASKIDTVLKLGKKSFLIQKRYKLSSKKIQNLYISLISFDKKIKTGFTIGNQEEELFNELESRILLTVSSK